MKMIPLRIAAAAFALLCVAAAPAQQYPARAIRLHVTTLPGGAPDIVARVVGQKLSEVLGQPVVVDNRPGSNGNIAAEATAKAAPDGHTLMVCAEAQLVINPHLFKKLPFDPLKDLTAIATLVSNEFVLAINPALPIRKEKFSNAGALEPFITTPAELTALIRSEYAKYGKLIKDIGAVVE